MMVGLPNGRRACARNVSAPAGRSGLGGPFRVSAAPGPSVGTAWMVTFSDLVVLMLAFFVLMFSMSAFKSEAFERLTASLTDTFNPQDRAQPTQAPVGGPFGVDGLVRVRGQDLGYLAAVLDTTFARDPRFAGTVVQVLDGQVVVLLPADLLFGAGRATVSVAARPVVRELAALLGHLRNRIAVAGHTDPGPLPADSPFVGPWDLSLARAAAVANGLIEAGYPTMPEVRGHGATRFGTLAEVAEAERSRLARRVDVVILPDRVEGVPE